MQKEMVAFVCQVEVAELVDCRHHSPDSQVAPHVMTNNLLDDELINGIVINAHDITEKIKIRQELKEALTKKGAFRGFRVVIEKYPHEKEHWIEFKRNATLKLIKDWLANFGFELEFATNEKKYQRR